MFPRVPDCSERQLGSLLGMEFGNGIFKELSPDMSSGFSSIPSRFVCYQPRTSAPNPVLAN